MVNGLVIWAHSPCPSTSALYREVARQAPCPVRIVYWKDMPSARARQGYGACGGEAPVMIGNDGRLAGEILSQTSGWTHVVCAYQESRIHRHVMRAAKARGDRVIVHSEAPCELCVGLKAWLKRAYYRFVLPLRTRPSVKCADLILNQSGSSGFDRLMRLGWSRGQIIPFGYVTDRLRPEAQDPAMSASDSAGGLKVLHPGSEDSCRGVGVLEKAVEIARRRGVAIECRRTGGVVSQEELVRLLRAADVVVGCGLSEPWGIRINDAIQEGVPVVVSDGMGVSWLVEREGCGCVVPRGDAQALADVLERCAEDRPFLARLRSGARQAAERWRPQVRAREFLRHVLGCGRRRRVVHLLAGLGPTSGVANIARRFAHEQRTRGDDVRMLAPAFKWNPIFFSGTFAWRAWRAVRRADEVWVHCSWTFPVWFGALLAKGLSKRLVVVPEGSFDPMRLNNRSGWKKRLVAPLDRWVLRQADSVLALCTAEAAWIRSFEPAAKVECARVPASLPVDPPAVRPATAAPCHVLFIGRAADPLKGVRFLEKAVAAVKGGRSIELRIVGDHTGEALESDWTWCDVLCLPTLSENFGLVVAEALEHRKPVLTTDGAPAWENQPGVTYLKGYVAASDEVRVRMLADALCAYVV